MYTSLLCGFSSFQGATALGVFYSMGRLFTFGLTVKENHGLVTTSPYAHVRHPNYSGFFLVVAGLLLVHFTKGSWLVEANIMQTPAAYVVIVWARGVRHVRLTATHAPTYNY